MTKKLKPEQEGDVFYPGIVDQKTLAACLETAEQIIRESRPDRVERFQRTKAKLIAQVKTHPLSFDEWNSGRADVADQPEVSEARLRNQAENMVGDVFDHPIAGYKTLKLLMIDRITAALLVAYRSGGGVAAVKLDAEAGECVGRFDYNSDTCTKCGLARHQHQDYNETEHSPLPTVTPQDGEP